MKAFVTGGTGCVGRNLTDVLIEQGWNVVAAHRSRNLDRMHPQAELFAVDMTQPFKMPQVDAVFHCAANLSHSRRDWAEQYVDNVLMTKNIATAATGKMVYTSTGAETGHYATTKREAERHLPIDACTLRPAIVIGAHDWNNYSRLFDTRFTLPGRLEFCDARSIAKAHVAALDRTGAYTLGGVPATWLEVSQIIAKLRGWGRPIVIPRFVLPLILGRELASLLKDGSTDPGERQRALDDLGYESAGLDSMLEDCWVWMRGNQG